MNELEKELWEVFLSDKKSKLQDVLFEVEFWENGSADVEEDGEFWVSGDNGRENISNLLEL